MVVPRRQPCKSVPCVAQCEHSPWSRRSSEYSYSIHLVKANAKQRVGGGSHRWRKWRLMRKEQDKGACW